MKIFSMATVIIAIIMFEYSYNKENGKTALIGVEILVIAILTLVITYINILYQEKIPIMIILYIITGISYIMMISFVSPKNKDYTSAAFMLLSWIVSLGLIIGIEKYM